jgi:transcriptional regulator with XRE-family HTH domain
VEKLCNLDKPYFLTFLGFYLIIIGKGVDNMSELGNKDVFSANLTYYLAQKDVMQKDLAKHLGISQASVNDWIKKRTYPRMDKLQMTAEFLGVKMTDLVEPRNKMSSTEDKRISDKEQLVLDLFHKVPDEKKDFLIKMIQAAIDN